jgi:4-amino-4-deoxy-L-arabinose transferase-like glycosyltransferase
MRRLDPRVSGFAMRLGAIVAAAFGVRIVYALAFTGDPVFLTDPDIYHNMANLIADGRGFVRPYDLIFRGQSIPTADHPPLHTFVLAGVSALGGTGVGAHKFAGCVAGAGTVAVTGLLGRRLLGDRVGLTAAGLAAVYPNLVIADGSLMSESLYGLLIGLVLLVAYGLYDNPSPARTALLGGLIGLAALTRSEALVLVALLALPVALRGPGRLLRTAALLLALIATLLPWSIRNWAAFDRPVLISTNESVTLAGANCDVGYVGARIGYWTPDCLSQPRHRNEAKQAGVWRREGLDYAREHLGRLPVVVGARVLRTWDFFQPAYSIGRQSRDELRNRSWHKAGLAAYYLLLPAAVAGAVLLRRRRVPLLPLAAIIVMVTLSSATGSGTQRFRFAAEIPLIVLAAVSITALVSSLGSRGRTRD